MAKKDVRRMVAPTGKIVIRLGPDGSFRVDDKSLYGAKGVKQQAEAARQISQAIRAKRKSA